MQKSIIAVVASAGLAAVASAQTVVLTATINGAQEVPPVNTPATGSATITVDTSTGAWSMDIQFGTLTAPLSVAHIHRAPAGSNGPVVIGLDGIALTGGRPTWNLLTPGITSFNSGGALNAPFAFPAAELANLLSGQLYINIHSTAFPGGEIRGQIIPAPGALAVFGLAALAAGRRRR